MGEKIGPKIGPKQAQVQALREEREEARQRQLAKAAKAKGGGKIVVKKRGRGR